jgi:hypothetical protein
MPIELNRRIFLGGLASFGSGSTGAKPADVLDEMLKDPRYGPRVGTVDLRYSHYQSDGTLFAPQGAPAVASASQARCRRCRFTVW